MAQSYTTQDGITLYEPGAVVSTRVVAGQGGIATAGVVTLVGEANEGPHWSKEADLDSNVFGPDQINDVLRKYGSGRLVDAYRALVAAANDPAIVGAVSAVKFVKTNDSAEAQAILSSAGIFNYATLSARLAGTPGNLIKYKIETSQAEVAPTTGLISYCPVPTTTPFALRVNGKDQKSISVSAFLSGPDFALAVEDVDAGILVSGGDLKAPLSGLTGINATAAAPSLDELTVTLQAGSQFSGDIQIGDTAVIPVSGQYGATVTSVLAGAADANAGSYIVTNIVNTASSAVLTLKAINVTGTLVGSSGAINVAEDDLLLFSQVEISNETGMERAVAQGLTPDWSTTSNDGTNAVLEITSTEEWTATPQVGDSFKLSTAFAGIASGFYIVTGSTSKTVSIARLSSGSAGTTGTETTAAAGFIVERPEIAGTGKSLEFDGDTSSFLKNSSGDDAGLSDSVIYSSAEQISATTISRNNIEDVFDAGGDIIVSIGTTKADAKVVIDDSKLEFFEGTTSVFEATYDQFKTMKDVVDFINSKADYSASLGSTRYANISPSTLDRGTYYISSTGWELGRIKADATSWLDEVNQSGLITAELTTQSGLPEGVTPEQFLSGGAKNGTTSLQVSQAFDALNFVETNFIVTCFSKDATDDIGTGETDSSSTYTIDAINALARNHVIAASALKAKKNRIALVSKSGSYADQKEAAGDVGSFRVGFSIQDCRLVNSQGQITTYQPWMSSVIAAGMQAAAGYKGIVKKFANVTGISHEAGDFNSKSQSQREDALRSGLLVMESVNTGGFRWISDQTSYTIDNNFVFNSLQAVYIADLMALSLINSFERVIVGQSIAEVSATAALGFLESELFNFKRLKWITSSDDAPKGWKNASIRVQGGVMSVNVEVKLAGLIYFVPINLAISEVTQEATQ